MKKFLVAAFAAFLLCAGAQAQSASGISNTSCNQSASSLICTSTTTLALPSGTNLTGMQLPQGSGAPVGPISALSACSVTPSSVSVAQGAAVSLTAACSTGTAAGSLVSFQWFKNGTSINAAIAPAYQVQGADTANTGASTYSVQITNAAPSAAFASATVNVTPNVVDGCPAEPVRLVINASEAYRRFYTTEFVQNFIAGQNFVVALDVSAADTTVGRQLATVGFADFGASRGGRYATISRSKCDYSDNAQWISSNFYGTKTPANGAAASVTIGNDAKFSDIKLTQGRWYINIQNAVGQCPVGVSCHAVIQWSN